MATSFRDLRDALRGMTSRTEPEHPSVYGWGGLDVVFSIYGPRISSAPLSTA
jgi:hypothetical protein